MQGTNPPCAFVHGKGSLLVFLSLFLFLLLSNEVEGVNFRQPRETERVDPETLHRLAHMIQNRFTEPASPEAAPLEDSSAAQMLEVLQAHAENRVEEYLAQQRLKSQLSQLNTTASALNPVVETQFGPVAGRFDDNGLALWLGIPFAAPPVGNLRWKPPQPPHPWKETKNCWLPPTICPQFGVEDLDLFLGEEDCLYLNVWAPKDYRNKKLPVLFWIYGGGFGLGDGYEFGLYDATDLMKHLNGQFIFVSFNYRVGPFGFLALDQLRREDPDATSGNYGVQDQQMALRWVQKNIPLFGGDPNSVTIFGESAGAFSVCWHMGAESSRGLFHKAIMQSGTCDSPDFFTSFESAASLGQALTSSIGCNQNSPNYLSCIRSASTRDIMFAPLFNGSFPTNPPRRLAPAMPWGIAIDGSSRGTKRTPLQSMREGNFNRVPLIAGVNRDEGSIFIFLVSSLVPGVTLPLTEETTRTVLLHFFENRIVDGILSLYPISDFPSHDARMARILDDYMFTCSTRRAVRAVAAAGLPAYMYRFNFVNEWIDRKLFGAYHSADLVYTFRHPFPNIPGLRDFSPLDYEVADQMNGYWFNFARAGNPNNGVLPNWPQFREGDTNLIFDLPPGQRQQGLRSRQCDFFDTIVGQ